jgi:hypothetical protein
MDLMDPGVPRIIDIGIREAAAPARPNPVHIGERAADPTERSSFGVNDLLAAVQEPEQIA